jgi:O-antigen/teichoic acid export membrane protein
MRQSVRILFNAGVMFGRMALTFGVGLYATRVLVNLLGHADYGLLATLGATGILLVFLGRGLNDSAQRNLAHEIGRGDPTQLEAVFVSTLVLFLAMSAAVLLFGVLIEPLVIRAIQIPPGREEAASRVFLLTLLNLIVLTATTPFRAVVNARQAMGQVAAFDLLRSTLSLVSVLLLFVVEGDALVLYAMFLLIGALLRCLAMALLCAWRFPEARAPGHQCPADPCGAASSSR